MPTPPKHFKDEIQAWLDQRLDVATRAEVERHVESCEECRREFEALRWTKQVRDNSKRLSRQRNCG